MKASVASVLGATSSEENFGLKQSLVLAANHVSFAATSDDASANVQQSARCSLATSRVWWNVAS